MFTGSFTAAQSSNITDLTITDTSSYASEGQGTFSGRKIYLYKIDGTTLVPAGTLTAYVDFPFTAGAALTIPGILTKDYALAINVVWLSTNPQPGSVYTSTQIAGFDYYLQAGLSQIIGAISGNPNILNDTQYYQNLGQLQTEIDNLLKSISDGQQFSAQAAIDRGTKLLQNKQLFF